MFKDSCRVAPMWNPLSRTSSPMWQPRSGEDNPGEGSVSAAAPSGGLAVIEFDGALTARPNLMDRLFDGETMGTSRKLQMAVLAADANAEVSTTLLTISSGGGDVEGMMAVQNAIANSTNRFAVWTEFSMSAAVVVISGANVIAGPPTAEVGSLSVRKAALDESEALKKAGLEVVVESPDELKKSTATGTPVDKTRRAEMLKTATAIKAAVTPAVAAGRGMTVEAVDALGAHEFVGQAAVDAGLMDAIFPDLAAFVAFLTQPDKEADMAEDPKKAEAVAESPGASEEKKSIEAKAEVTAPPADMSAAQLQAISAAVNVAMTPLKEELAGAKAKLAKIETAGELNLAKADAARLQGTNLDKDSQELALAQITEMRAAAEPNAGLIEKTFVKAEATAKTLPPTFFDRHAGDSAREAGLAGQGDVWLDAARSGGPVDMDDAKDHAGALAYAAQHPDEKGAYEAFLTKTDTERGVN